MRTCYYLWLGAGWLLAGAARAQAPADTLRPAGPTRCA